MLEKTTKEFLIDAENIIIGAVVNDDFVTIKTKEGNAVLISESEWNIMVDALKVIMAQTI